MLKKPLIPEWRYWPSVALAGLAVLALGSVATAIRQSPDQPANQQQIQSAANDPNSNGAPQYRWWEYASAWDLAAQIALAMTTIGLWALTWRTANAAREQTQLSRRAFVALHRPRMRIRLVRIDPLETGKPIVIHFIAANIGETDARNVMGKVNLQVLNVVTGTDGIKNKPTHWPEDVQVAKVIPPGSDPVEMRVVTGIKPERDWKVKADWGDGRIHVHGTVTYSDLNNVTHVTGFYRYSTSDVNRFVLPTREDIKRDYEYED